MVYLSVRLKGPFCSGHWQKFTSLQVAENELDKVQGVVINPFDEHPELVDWAYFEDDSK